METILGWLSTFILAYPLGMSIIWLIGTLWHFFAKERKKLYSIHEQPFVSILVPAYNEMEVLHNAIDKLHQMNYKKYEIIVINDGSSDQTAALVEKILPEYPRLRFVNSVKNQGKAHAMLLGSRAARGEYLICVDADSYLDKNAIIHLIAPMLPENDGSEIGAVTGNPRVRNRPNILAKIQTAEYSSVVGMIKRTQQMINTCMTVSGVCVAFRKQALYDVGYWDEEVIAEDIAVTWKLHARGWKIIYNPRAICWMLVPEKIGGLFKQRLRWSQGGMDVLLKNFWPTVARKDYRNLTLLIEQILGIAWACAYLISVPFILFQIYQGEFHFITLQIRILAGIALMNYAVAFIVDKRYDRELFKTYFWVIWYPFLYWIFNVIVTITALVKTVLIRTKNDTNQEKATWESPDRGEIIDHGVQRDVLLVHSSTSKIGKWIGYPITILVWFSFITSVLSVFFIAIYNAVIFNQDLVTTLINADNRNYYFFLMYVGITGTVLLYFANITTAFPIQPHHMQLKNIDKAEAKKFGFDDLLDYKYKKIIVVEEDDEINNV